MNPPLLFFLNISLLCCGALVSADDLTDAELASVRRLEQARIETIDKVIGSVVAIYDDDRQGGGSGVIIDPAGIALTNHHVIMGAGVKGWGGLADGKLYRWTLIGTDPGGDVAIIQLEGKDTFPCSPLGDSDDVRVGDWALAMGNPFILTEDQKPTVTLGIVSGVKRYQEGAGSNQLVYGNCIQVDSSINPGNSGGPLFNLTGEVIGINGRGSFLERGRVNVGLGYAISSNQIKNFVPDLLATKLVEHGTLDASFSDRGGKVVCSTINQDAPVAEAGLVLGDELLEFEGVEIRNANQYTNLICTLPEDWPAQLRIRNAEGEERTIHVRMYGLPYQVPAKPRMPGGGDEKPTPEEQRKMKRAQEMFEMLSAKPGTIRSMPANRMYAQVLFRNWRQKRQPDASSQTLHFTDEIVQDDVKIGQQEAWISADGKFRIALTTGKDTKLAFVFDGTRFVRIEDGKLVELTRTEAKLNPQVVQAFAVLAASGGEVFAPFGKLHLDGGDKALGKSASRFKVLDEDEDWFFFWLTHYEENGNAKTTLAKASADKDCDRNQGGIAFEQWTQIGPWKFPQVRKQVRGLGEELVASFANIRFELVDEESGWFQVPDSLDESGGVR